MLCRPTLKSGLLLEPKGRSVSRLLCINVVSSSCGDDGQYDPRLLACVEHLEIFGQGGPRATPSQSLAQPRETS